MEFSGRLAAFPPGELLQWAHNERRTGSLVFRRSRRQKRLCLRRGEIVACLSDDPADFYGQHLLTNGFVEEPQLVDALSYCSRTGKRLGQSLIDMGFLSVEQVRKTLGQQLADSVCGLFLWKNGVFYFEDDPPPDEEVQPEAVSTMGLVLEGTRWVDEFARFRRVIPHDNVILQRGPAWPGYDLSPVQARIVQAVDGEKTICKLHTRIKGSYFRLLEGVYQLCMKEVLDLGAIGESVETTSLEINVYDLLLEQAVEEQVQASEPGPTLPIAVIGELRPVWVRPLAQTELAELPDELAELASTFDGTLPIAGLAVTGTGDAQRWDFLVEQLRKGRLALLPASPEELASHVEGRLSWWRRIFPGSSS